MADSSSQQCITERFLDFTLTVEWELKNPDSTPTGFFRIILPYCFPLSMQQQTILVTEESSSESITVNSCVDSFFIDAAFRNPFTFLLLYSPNSPDIKPETYIPEKISLDGSLLFIPDTPDPSFTVEDFDIFSKIQFSMYCETQLLTEEIYQFFSPSFIHIWKLTNLPSTNDGEAPLFFICKIKETEINILSHGQEINAVIPIEYRNQETITFEVRNHEKFYPTTFIGSGIIRPYTEKQPPSQNYGTTTFDLLPERRKRARITQANEEEGNDFNQDSYELSYHIFDPSSDLENPPTSRPAISRPPEKIKPEETIEIDDNSLNQDLINKLEKSNTKLIRWVFTCTRSDGTWHYASKILQFVQKYHKNACKLQSSPPLAPFATSKIRNPVNNNQQSNDSNDSTEKPDERKYSFEKFYRANKDVITGVQILTPNEQIIILETRGQEPMNSAKGLENLLRKFDQEKAHILANKTFFFQTPRLYCLFDSCMSKVSLPLSMGDLLRIEGLYFPKSPNYKFYPVLTKLSHIHESNTFNEMVDGDLFPTFDELMFLTSHTGHLYTIPFQKGMPPMTISESRGPNRAHFGGNGNIMARTFLQDNANKTDKNNRKQSKAHDNDRNRGGVDSFECGSLNSQESIERSEIIIHEYPQFDVPEALLLSARRNSFTKSIVTPNERLTNYSLSMTANQRQIYKTRHIKAAKIRKAEEWIRAVDYFNKSQERLAKTYHEEAILLDDGYTNRNKLDTSGGFRPIGPPPKTAYTLASPRRNIREPQTMQIGKRRSNSFGKMNQGVFENVNLDN